MKRNIKLKGRLRNYMYWPMILTILLAVFNVPVYMINTKSAEVLCLVRFTDRRYGFFYDKCR